MPEMTVDVFNIQHFSTGDGPGIRTTVFLEGCNLRCPWCHNPESFYTGVHPRSIDDILNEVMGDEEFYRQSGGGVTLSGGEPLLQGKGCMELLRNFKEKGLHTIVDTALDIEGIDLSETALFTDTFYTDLKTADEEKYASVCGGSMDVFIRNLERLIQTGADIVLRIPLIPGFNMDSCSIGGIIALAKKYDLPVTLLPFHRLGSAKYKNLGLVYKYADTEPSSDKEIEDIRQKFTDEGVSEANT